MINKVCKKCGKSYKVLPYRKNLSFYCSRECQLPTFLKKAGHKIPHTKRGIENISKGHIGLKYPNRKSPPPFTKEHRINIGKLNKGNKNFAWRGGVNSTNDTIRKSIEYKLWRKSCFERDNYTCQKTDISGGKLVVHHINNFADYPELRFAIDNGITLSEKAHREFHKIYGTRNNTLEQLNEFLCRI